MPECIRIIPRAKLTRIADLSENTPEWNEHLKLLSAEGCLCVMHDEKDPSDKFYLILFDYPKSFKSFIGDLEETTNEIRLITKDTGYVFTVTDSEMTEEKKSRLNNQLNSLLALLETEKTLSEYLNNNNNNNDNR